MTSPVAQESVSPTVSQFLSCAVAVLACVTLSFPSDLGKVLSCTGLCGFLPTEIMPKTFRTQFTIWLTVDVFPTHLSVCALLSLWTLSQAALQVGGHGERLCQCRQVVLTTSKAIPMQVDGEPCKLAASCIHISLRNQANMVQKTKRRNSMPLLNE